MAKNTKTKSSKKTKEPKTKNREVAKRLKEEEKRKLEEEKRKREVPIEKIANLSKEGIDNIKDEIESALNENLDKRIRDIKRKEREEKKKRKQESDKKNKRNSKPHKGIEIIENVRYFDVKEYNKKVKTYNDDIRLTGRLNLETNEIEYVEVERLKYYKDVISDDLKVELDYNKSSIKIKKYPNMESVTVETREFGDILEVKFDKYVIGGYFRDEDKWVVVRIKNRKYGYLNIFYCKNMLNLDDNDNIGKEDIRLGKVGDNIEE